jgi:diguanylate cyclase (GGDEF)-like protein
LSYSVQILPFAVSAGLVVALLVFALLNWREPIAPWLSGTLVALLIWTVAYIFELSSTSLESKLLWANVQFFGSVTAPVFWLYAMRTAVGARALPKWLDVTLWAVCAALLVAVLTDPGGLFRGEPFLSAAGSLTVVDADYGPIFYVGVAYMYVLLAAALVILLRAAAHTQRPYQRREVILVTATLLPMIGGGLYVADVLPWHNYNPATAAITVSALLCGYVLWRYRLFDVAPLARDAVIEHLADGVIVLNRSGQIVDYNPTAARVFPELTPAALGCHAEGVLSCRAAIVDAVGRLAQADGEAVGHDDASDAADEPVFVEVEDIGDVLGRGARHFSMALTAVKNRGGRRLGVAIVLHDVTHSVELFQQVQQLASTDGLTGLLMRRRFFELAEQELARARRHGLPLSLLLLDLDHFKLVNDVHGHSAGDLILRAVATACREALRSFDIIGRFGGDELCVLLPHDDGVEGAQVAERLRAVVAGLSVWCAGELVRTTVSVGVVAVDSASVETFTDLMDAADQALYAAKHEGRDRVCVWTA